LAVVVLVSGGEEGGDAADDASSDGDLVFVEDVFELLILISSMTLCLLRFQHLSWSASSRGRLRTDTADEVERKVDVLLGAGVVDNVFTSVVEICCCCC